jgi:hypothetical protein
LLEPYPLPLKLAVYAQWNSLKSQFERHLLLKMQVQGVGSNCGASSSEIKNIVCWSSLQKEREDFEVFM